MLTWIPPFLAHHKMISELPNLVASNIENFMLLLSSMEHRLSEAMDEENNNDRKDSDNGDNDDIMKKRIEIAKLVSETEFGCFFSALG